MFQLHFHGCPLYFHGFPLDSIGFYRIPWISTGFHWILSDSKDFHRIPLDSTEFHRFRIQTKSELRQNRNSDKIGTHSKFKRPWEKKSFRLSPYIYNKLTVEKIASGSFQKGVSIAFPWMSPIFPWISIGFHWILPDSMDFHRIPLDSVGFQGFPPDSIGFYRIPQVSNSNKIATQTKSRHRQNRDTDKIGTHRKSKRPWEKKSFRLSPYIYNK